MHDDDIGRCVSRRSRPNVPMLGFVALTALSVGLAQCSGSGGTARTIPGAPATATPTPSPSGSPSASPSRSPSAAPSPSHSPSPSPTPSHTPSPAPTASPTPPATSCTSLLASAIYVTNEANNSITVYPGNPSGTLNEAPLATIIGNKTGLNAPGGIAVDASGRIYVANFDAASVTVYPANPCGTLNEAPLATITGSNTTLVNPVGVALDASGKIYVSNGVTSAIGSGAGTIVDFAANPSGTLNEAPLSQTSLPAPEGLALDGSGNIYVAIEESTNNSIVVYGGSSSGMLPGAPFATISGPNTGLVAPTALAVDASGRIYETSPITRGVSPESVLVYATITNGGGNEAPLATITGSNTGLLGAAGVAIDPSGKIYVVNYATGTGGGGSVTVYAANPSGTLNETPIATIIGTNTAFHQPEGIAVRPSASGPVSSPSPAPSPTASAGPTPKPTPTPVPTPTPSPSPAVISMYVAESGNNSITVTAITPGGGDEAPRSTIAGSNTGLSQPNGIALDKSGRIYVANEDANASGAPPSITIYAANPSATDALGNPSPTLNETPLATITGSKTGLAEPTGVAVDAAGRIYVSNAVGGAGNGSITVYAANPSGTLNEAPIATIYGIFIGLNNPAGVALDASGKIYVANNALAGSGGVPSITVYAANPSGTLVEAPLATIAGGATGLSGADGLALDASGKIYVAVPNNSIAVFAANPTGSLNEAPLATIIGSNTQLSEPFGVALDAGGRIYVTNTAYPSITFYAANPSGTLNETPLAEILGSDARLSSPVGIAIH
jgi:sugar lactone lactonase YvrE